MVAPTRRSLNKRAATLGAAQAATVRVELEAARPRHHTNEAAQAQPPQPQQQRRRRRHFRASKLRWPILAGVCIFGLCNGYVSLTARLCAAKLGARGICTKLGGN